MSKAEKRTIKKAVRDRDARWLRGRKPRPLKHEQRDPQCLRVADLFCGCGGMTLGLQEAVRRVGYEIEVVFAVDSDEAASETFAANFPGALVKTADINDLFPGSPGAPLSLVERSIREQAGPIDVLLLGAPCQGHSDLNNHTRRNDPKNALYFKAARAAEVLEALVVVAENVPNAQRDEDEVVLQTTLALEALGFATSGAVLDVAHLGLPQKRRRFVLIASALPDLDPTVVFQKILERKHPVRDVRWAIGDLEHIDPSAEMDQPSRMSSENVRRTKVLFDKNLLDLPDGERPPCHRDNDHSYKSVYGRLQWESPAQTITTGFTSMGQGRYIHPSKPRTLTPHEAARLQTFPDWFKWPIQARTRLARMIGNAVPPLLMVQIGVGILTAVRKTKWKRPPNDQSSNRKAPYLVKRGDHADASGATEPDETGTRTANRVARSRPQVRHEHSSDQRVTSPS